MQYIWVYVSNIGWLSWQLVSVGCLWVAIGLRLLVVVWRLLMVHEACIDDQAKPVVLDDTWVCISNIGWLWWQ